MKYINIHTHLPLLDNEDVISVVDVSSSATISTPYCSYGVHPWFLTEKNAESQLCQLEILLKINAITAIGEVGFDAVRGAKMDLQQRIFDAIISLSEYYQKPLIIHCVKAYDRILSLHKKRNIEQTWIVHGFKGSCELALQLISRNIMLSFGCKLLKDDIIQSVLEKIPTNSIFLETDDADVNIVDIYKIAATIRKIDIETLRGILYESFIRVFSTVKP